MTIKGKIMLWYTSLLALLLCILIPLIYFSMKNNMYDNAEGLLKMHTSQALSTFEYDDNNISLGGFKNLSGTSFIIFDKDNNVLLKTEYSANLDKTPSNFGNVFQENGEDGHWLVYDLQLTEDNNISGWIRAYSSLEPIEATLQNLRLLIIVLLPIYLLIAILGGLFLSKKALSPIDKITKTAKSISTGDLSKRLNMPNTGDEVGRLAETFDEMLDRLDQSFKKEKSFTSNASHELRTPLSVIISNAEFALNGEQSEAKYKESLDLILSESNKMSSMISKLLMLTRGDESNYKYEFEQIDLGLIIEDVVEEMQEAAIQKNISLSYTGKKNIFIIADQTLIVRLLINLIDNAIKYSDNQGNVSISLRTKDKFAEISIEDKGIGIPETELPQIFNRFYRVDKSRSSEGSGLGLSIVKWIVDIHKGSVDIKSKLKEGTIIKVKLPLDKTIMFG